MGAIPFQNRHAEVESVASKKKKATDSQIIVLYIQLIININKTNYIIICKHFETCSWSAIEKNG